MQALPPGCAATSWSNCNRVGSESALSLRARSRLSAGRGIVVSVGVQQVDCWRLVGFGSVMVMSSSLSLALTIVYMLINY
jgi:hypothetical protein